MLDTTARCCVTVGLASRVWAQIVRVTVSDVITPRRMISAAEFLESGAVPVDIAARVLSVPLSEMDAGQSRVLCLIASMFGHRWA